MLRDMIKILPDYIQNPSSSSSSSSTAAATGYKPSRLVLSSVGVASQQIFLG
jgi:hypothetical protein